MSNETTPILAFTGLGLVLAGLAYVVTTVAPGKTGADALPPYVPTVTPGVPAVPPEAQPVVSTGGAKVLRLLQEPTLSQTEIAFAYAGQIWVVGRAGGEARKLVSGQLADKGPHFSPDGSWIAYTGTLDANEDVYVVPAAGGEPKRLTYYPGADVVLGWSPDGQKVLFRSSRHTTRDLDQLYTVGLNGGAPEELPLPSGDTAAFSPDGTHLAYVPYQQWQAHWRKYRGGQTTPVWIADLKDSKVTPIPRDNSNDRFPMWTDDGVFFLSDRNGPTTLFQYDPKTAAVRELVKNPDGFDIGTASAGPGGIVYEQMGEIHLFDPKAGTSKLVPIAVSAELPELRPRFEHVEPKKVLHAALSPTGKRVLLETRGEILSAPALKGDVRNLTRTPGSADRDPAWSPDGKWVAWLSDESGEYALYLRAPDGLGPLKKVTLSDQPSFYYSPRWSPDSQKIVLLDKQLHLLLIDLDHPQPVVIDTAPFEDISFDPSWSPDSRFVAYVKELPSHFHAIFVHSLDEKKSYQVTDGRSDALAPRFDRGGKVLFFVASTDVGPAGAGSMLSMGRPVTNNAYALVLQKDEPSPVGPESDEEGETKTPAGSVQAEKAKDDQEKKDDGEKDKKKEKKPVPRVRIDFEGTDQRVVALPIDRGTYDDLEVGEKGVLFLVAGPSYHSDEEDFDEHEPPFSVKRFDLKTRKTETFIPKIERHLDGGGDTFSVSADGTKVLYAQGDKFYVAAADKPVKANEDAVKLDGADVWVDPRAEWQQIYREVWRIERDFLYDPHFHGLDLAAAEKLYARYLPGIASREDLNVLLEAGLGNIVLGHVWASGGSMPPQKRVGIGLLGADYVVEQGHYRIARILRGENWNPKLRAPLTEPGVNVKEGDFLLEVNGEPLAGSDDVFRLFQDRAGRQTVIKVGANPDGAGARTVTVVPVGSEAALRLRTWMEDNRKKVDELSGGRVGYVYIPDTGWPGLDNFNRYYFSQSGKEGIVIDERFNHGGHIADYIVEVLARTPLMGAMTREGGDTTIPFQAVFGPKVMIANQMSGSGGDALPWLFKRANLGPLVGVRTWGGLVGIGGYPRLVDGGHITAPRWALYGTKGEFEVENKGIAPDVEVVEDPAVMRQGHDPQLEKAVALALEALAKNPVTKLQRPPYPNYGDRLPKVSAGL